MDRRPAKLRSRLGLRLRELRRSQRMTQEQLAARAGLSYKFVGEIERGTGNPTVDTLAALSAALEVEVPELFGGSTDSQQTVPVQDWERLRAVSLTLSEIVTRRDDTSARSRRRPAKR